LISISFRERITCYHPSGFKRGWPIEKLVPGKAQEHSPDGYREHDKYFVDRANLKTNIEVEPSKERDEPGYHTSNERDGT
jgi:hypothetical protein